MNTIALDKEYVANTYARFNLEFVSGKGAIIKCTDGKEYIDMGTGIGVNIFGFCDQEWTNAVTKQLGEFQHCSNLYYSAPCANLAKMLCDATGLKNVFFANSGAEANECAIKVARQYSKEKYGDNRFKILTLKNSFHGRTITTLSATGQEVFHQKFLPLTEGFVYAEANNFESVEKATEKGDICAIMMEAVQGEGGVIPLEKEFVKKVSELANKKDILIIFDEVQTGNGRTGELYGYMNFNAKPDIITTAKGLGGGLPIGACVMGEKVSDVLGAGDHGSTFGGNPVASAGAISILSRLTPEFLSEVKEKSKLIFSTLSGAQGIKSVTGLGLMIGIETEKPAGEVISACIDMGVIPLKAKNKVRLLPPLNIDNETLLKALDIIKKAVK